MLIIISIFIGLYLLYAGLAGVSDYELLRGIVFTGGLLYSYLLNKEEHIDSGPKSFYFIFIASLIILFNPFYPVYLYNRELWILIDVGSGLISLSTILFIKAQNDSFIEDVENIFSKKSVVNETLSKPSLIRSEIQFLPLISKYLRNNLVLEELISLMNDQNKNKKITVKFNVNEHSDLIYYHLVCYIGSLVKIHLTSNEKIELFYVNQLTNNLEEELLNFKYNSNIDNYNLYKPLEYGGELIYDPFCKLLDADLPYISQLEYNSDDYRKVSISLVTNFSLIFQPINLYHAGLPFQPFVSSLAKHATYTIRNHSSNYYL